MDYRTPAACLDLLRGLDTRRVDEAHHQLVRMVHGLLQAAPPPARHLEVLEAARATVAQVQEEMARRYADHPLPPDGRDNETLQQVAGLWQRLADSYVELALRDTATELHRPLLAQRRLHYQGQVLFEHFRAHRAVPAGLWAAVHRAYAAAEAHEVAGVRVPDPLNEVWKAQSSTEAYIAALLVELANPFGRTEQEFAWICRWAQRFAPYCSLGAEIEGVKPTDYGLDLSADHGLRPLGLLSASSQLRRFDATRLGTQIKAVLTQFKQGVSPASLGLGRDCTIEASSRLLLSLYRPWGLAAAGRRFPRRGCQGKAELCSDWLAIGFHIAGSMFTQPRALATPHSLNSDVALMTFGEKVPDVAADAAAARRHAAERLGLECVAWEVADKSVGGFRLQQQPHLERLEHNQLVGILPPDGERFLLGMVNWLMYRADGVMEAGVHVLPGLPKRVAARQIGLRTERTPYQQAFLLPATPALKTGPTLVLPAGWFQPNRVVEVYDERPVQVRLGQIIVRGADFDQVSFEPLGSPP